MAVAICYASLEMGVAVFDASVGGLGGCPYAAGASGNVATEDVVWLLNGLGIDTGIDLDALVDTAAWISAQLGREPASRVARAVLAKPEIFIMDEATSSVDTLTEALIQQGMETLMAGRTSVVIAHRLSTIRSAHRILVVQEGRIAEQGSHEELLRKQGAYARLYHTQNLGEIPYETGEDRSDQ